MIGVVLESGQRGNEEEIFSLDIQTTSRFELAFSSMPSLHFLFLPVYFCTRILFEFRQILTPIFILFPERTSRWKNFYKRLGVSSLWQICFYTLLLEVRESTQMFDFPLCLGLIDG